MTEKKLFWRLRFVIFMSFFIAFLLLVRFAFIMLSPKRVEINSIQTPTITERGPIVDRNGRLVALQNRLWSVTAWKPEIEDSLQVSKILGSILNQDPNRIAFAIANARSRFLFIRRKVTPTQSDAIAQLIDEGALPGIGLQEEFGRYYPNKELAAPLIGYVGTDNTGLDGIEYAFDRVLSPSSITGNSAALYGHTVHLTLDMNTQYIVERITDNAWEKHRPDAMMILVMDAYTGEFLSWVSKPSFNPNTFTESLPEQRINRPLAVTYEPGSVFKVFTWASLLDKNAVQMNSIFKTSGGYEPEIFLRYGIAPINDLADYGNLDPSRAFIHSSNVAVAQATEAMDADTFYKSLKNFGFGAPTNLPLPGESHGLLNTVNYWSIRSQPTIAIGQEVGVSAVQIMAAATVLANGGMLLRPRIVSHVSAADGSLIKEYPRHPVREVISPKTAHDILEMMEKVVDSPVGTARNTRIPGLRISAKSGTAQIADPETKTYSEDRYLSSVLALLPTEKPQLIIYVVLENPQGENIYGAQTAAPIAREIIEKIGPFYGIELPGNTVLEHPGLLPLDSPPRQKIGEILHNLSGYSKRQILPYLNHKDIQWSINGEGWVVFQFPPPGTPIESGMRVYLELK